MKVKSKKLQKGLIVSLILLTSLMTPLTAMSNDTQSVDIGNSIEEVKVDDSKSSSDPKSLFDINKKKDDTKEDIKILFISGADLHTSNDLDYTADIIKGFNSLLALNIHVFNTVKVRRMYLNTLSHNTIPLLLYNRLSTICYKINRFRPNCIFAMDEASLMVLNFLLLNSKITNTPKIYYYSSHLRPKLLSTDAYPGLKKYNISGITPNRDFNLFFSIFDGLIVSRNVVIITNKSNTSFIEKLSHDFLSTYTTALSKRRIHYTVVSADSIVDLCLKLKKIKSNSEMESMFIICTVFGMKLYQSDTKYNGLLNVIKGIQSVVKGDYILSPSYLSARVGATSSFSPNFYRDGRLLFNLFIDTYFADTSETRYGSNFIIALNLSFFRDFYLDVLAKIQGNPDANIFVY